MVSSDRRMAILCVTLPNVAIGNQQTRHYDAG
jgi:hypothetical protein